MRACCRSWSKSTCAGHSAGASLGVEEGTRQLRDLLSRTLAFALAALLPASPTLAGEAESLGAP
jgi:diguanylate cyclase